MSFIYSRALAEAFLPGICLGTDASAQSSGSPTPKPCLLHDKTMEPSRLSQFGMTCKPLTESHGEALLMWLRAASPAKTYPLRGGVQALTENAQECGTTWPASLAKYDPASHSLKTAQLSLLEDSTGCSVTLPRSGLMRNGECWERPTLARLTSESASGYWLTPCAMDAKPITGGNLYQTVTGTVRSMNPDGSSSNRGLSTQVMWHTPNAMLGASDLNFRCSGDGRTKPNKLGWAVAEAMQQFPTPVRSDYKSGSFTQAGKIKRDSQSRGKPLNETIGGQLNPNWVEWLMGWPIGHTELKPLEMAKFQEWQQQHSSNYYGGKRIFNHGAALVPHHTPAP